MSENPNQQQKDHIPQGMYATLLVNCELESCRAMNSGDPFVTWRSLKTWFNVLPDECQADCLPSYKEIVENLNKIARNARQQDIFQRQAVLNRNQFNYLYTMTEKFMRTIKHSLQTRGWITKDIINYSGIDPNKASETL